MLIALSLILLVLLLLLSEKLLLNARVKKIPLRILVNGTRGKSSTVKLIASVLRMNNHKVFSKITGVVPTLFYTDETSEVIKRRGGARVTEQFRMIGKCVKSKSDAIVLECMSINPELQKIESRVLKPQFYIITNIMEDHLEELGSTPEEWVESICEAIPENCTVITSEKEHIGIIKKFASKKNSDVIFCASNDKIEHKINEGIHPDNLAIAETFASHSNLDTGRFFENIKREFQQDLLVPVNINGIHISFVNAFAANDVPSAKKIYEGQMDDSLARVVVFNSRGDRPYRTIKFMEWISNMDAEKYFITGTNSGLACKVLKRLGVNENKIVKLNNKLCDNFNEVLTTHLNRDSIVFGFGNIKDAGFRIINSLSMVEL